MKCQATKTAKEFIKNTCGEQSRIHRLKPHFACPVVPPMADTAGVKENFSYFLIQKFLRISVFVTATDIFFKIRYSYPVGLNY
jgi:hypothetical protein